MATETLLDLLEKERNMIRRKREVEFDIMHDQHGLKEAECFPEFVRCDAEVWKKHLELDYENLNDVSQKIPEIQVKIKDAMKAYENAEFISEDGVLR